MWCGSKTLPRAFGGQYENTGVSVDISEARKRKRRRRGKRGPTCIVCRAKTWLCISLLASSTQLQ